MNKINNENLYQILGIEKTASQQQIKSLVLKTSPENNPEVGKALMVLSDTNKRKEYDAIGWKSEWEDEWEKERTFRNSIFKAIQNYKHHYQNTEEYTPDGHRIWVIPPMYLDPSLWAPYEADSGVAWVNKIWGICGENWKQELEDFKNKMLAGLDKAWEKQKKTPAVGSLWEAVEKGNCAKCGKKAKLRKRDKYSDGKNYCSSECYWNNWEDGHDLPKQEKIPYSPDKSPRKKDNKERLCDKCHGEIGKAGYGSVDSHGNRGSFCSKNCRDTFSESQTEKSIVKIKRNAFIEILKWMEKQGIDSIRFDRTSGQLLVEYSGKVEKLVAEKDLTPELKEIKDYYQENSENTKSLSREAIRQEINKSGIEPKNEGNGMLIFGILVAGAVIFVLMGVIFHKKRIKRY